MLTKARRRMALHLAQDAATKDVSSGSRAIAIMVV